VPELRSRTAASPAEIARRALVASIIVLGLAVLALVLWKIRLVVFLLFFGIVIASAIRPGVERLREHGIPRGFGIALHYAAVAVVVGLLLWLAVPRAVSQVQNAISSLPQTRAQLKQEARRSHGLKRELLVGVERRLEDLPSGSRLLSPSIEVTRQAAEILVGIFFLFASAAYWIFERERTERVVLSLVPRRKHEVVSETWRLIDLRLGAFVRGQILLVLLVGTVLSLLFWSIGEPYWLLVGAFAGIVELVPLLGPLLAGGLAVGVGFSASWETALYAGLVVLAVRMVEDYVVVPRVLGDAVGLSPLIVLVAVSAAGVLLGGVAVLLAVPLAAVVATVVEVVVLKKDPARQEVPSVILSPPDSETTG
jgi:predicted PurR-regulated permease PerM